MRRWAVIAGALCLGLVAAGLSCLAAYVNAHEPGWRERGDRLDTRTQLALDVGMWWSTYGWMVVALVVAVAGIGWVLRQAVIHGRSAEARDFDEGPAGSVPDGLAEPDRRRL